MNYVQVYSRPSFKLTSTTSGPDVITSFLGFWTRTFQANESSLSPATLERCTRVTEFPRTRLGTSSALDSSLAVVRVSQGASSSHRSTTLEQRTRKYKSPRQNLLISSPGKSKLERGNIATVPQNDWQGSMTTRMYEVSTLQLGGVLITRKVEALNDAFEKQNADVEDKAVVSKGPTNVYLTLIYYLCVGRGTEDNARRRCSSHCTSER